MEEGVEDVVRALFLLKNCLCLPKSLYIIRCSPVWKVPWVLEEFEEVVLESLAEITNVEMTSGPWRQATLPVDLGGLGIRRTKEIALPAFLAWIHSVHQLVLDILPQADLDSEAELQIPAILESPGIFRKDKRRPDGMTQVPWKNGNELVWDVTVVDTLALTNFAMSTVKAGFAADAAEKRKITK
ncbi:hypothetical protein RvY_00826 [Ramazzottius varieornatus]|uniref:Uncharacterized protein n=1 Tax=Ramazzottius varieornatus TaxID=947166 RepID=A0A1D1UE48_RAMVA|nr:hypothetical protein RvY_00826 [Ramazzottius varieornatus]